MLLSTGSGFVDSIQVDRAYYENRLMGEVRWT
jgi:hypothetical protein